MCYECWMDLGKPRMRTPQIERCAGLVRKLYECSPVGGNLHIITDDWNLEDEHIEMCREYMAAIPEGAETEYQDAEDYAKQLRIEREIINLMTPMNEEERGAVLALQDGFLDE